MENETENTEKPYFLSLKWKSLLLLSGVFLLVNALLMWVGYHHLQHFFTSQLTQSVRTSANTQLEHAKEDLLLLGASTSLAANNTESAGINEALLQKYLSNNWPNFELDHGVDGIALFAPKFEKEFKWGEYRSSKPLHRLVTRVYLDLEPETQVICLDVCHIYAAQPLLMDDGEIYVVVLSKSLIDFIIQFSQNHNMDIALLRQTNNAGTQTKNTYWNYQLAGITSKQQGLKKLSALEKNYSLSTLMADGLSHQINGKTIYFHAITVEKNSSSTPSFLLLMTDISKQHNAIYKTLMVTAEMLIAGVLVIMASLFLILKAPMKRLQKQAELLPLLAQSGFETVRYEINQHKPVKKHINDELDILEETAISLSYQLEHMEREIGHRTNELENMALYDVLTGLMNRRYFVEKAEQILQHSIATQKSCAVAFIDLDNFKRINDSLGHEAGDMLLKQISLRLTENVRSTDIVARLGGDEFTLILPDVHHINNVKMIMDKILLSFQQSILLPIDKEVRVTPSMGIAIGPEHGNNISEIMRCADLAMYSAKRQGKNCYHFFNEKMNEDIQESLQLEKEIAAAIKERQFRLFYQPIIDLKTGEIVHMEALLRWMHPERGLLGPFSFIDMLEDSGQIVALGPQLFEMACLALKVLDNAGLEHITIAINISAKQFNDPDLIDKLLNVVEHMRVNPERLELEITENTLMENLEHQCFVLSKLQALGFKLAIDDFGTGYSSLSYLKELPVNILKVDRSFIKDIPLDKQDVAITSAIIAMAHRLDLAVIAEGIETPEQESFLKELGCEYGQGFLFQKPRPLEEFIDRLQANHLDHSSRYYQ